MNDEAQRSAYDQGLEDGYTIGWTAGNEEADALDAEIAKLKAENDRWVEIKNEEVNENCRIADRIGITEAIKAGKSYADAEIELFDELCAEIAKLREQLLEAQANQHDENCDTRDIMIQGKPCNCYVMLKAECDELKRDNEEWLRMSKRKDKIIDAHCKDCCCARAWRALGIMDSKASIPEHIEQLKAERDKYEKDAIYHRVRVEELKDERAAAYVWGLKRAQEIASKFWYERDDFDRAIQAKIDQVKVGSNIS